MKRTGGRHMPRLTLADKQARHDKVMGVLAKMPGASIRLVALATGLTEKQAKNAKLWTPPVDCPAPEPPPPSTHKKCSVCKQPITDLQSRDTTRSGAWKHMSCKT